MVYIKHFYNNLSMVWSKSSKIKKYSFFLLIYTGLFLITYFFAYSPFILANKGYIWIDGRLLEYPVLAYIGCFYRDLFLSLIHGHFEVPLFDLNIGLGSDIITTLNFFGLGDPLNIIAAFVPIEHTESLYNFFAIFRLYLAGLSFVFLCRYHKHRYSYSLIGALIYSFSGYGVFTSIGQPFFINAMIQLPLLLIGIDLIIKRQTRVIFILSVSYSALCGFYFLYMMTLMLGIYAVIRFFDIYITNRIQEFVKMAGRIILNYLLGLGLVAVIFIPAVVGYFDSSRAGVVVERNLFSYGVSYYIDVLLKFIAPSGASWNAFSLPAIIFVAIILLFSLRNKEYGILKKLFFITMLIYLLPLGGYIMNGFGYISQRWTFGAVLYFSYLTVVMLPQIFNMNKGQKLACFFALLIYSCIIFVLSSYRTIYLITGVAMFAITLSAFFLFSGKKEKVSMTWYNLPVVICMLLVIFNVSINAVYKFAPGLYNFSATFNEYGTETDDLEQAIERDAEPYLALADGRFEGSLFVHDRSMVWGVPSSHSYYNLTNKFVVDFWNVTENIAANGLNFNIQGTDQRTFINALMSIKYVIEPVNREKYTPFGYYAYKQTENDNLVFQNQYALPWGYTYDNYLLYDELLPIDGLRISEVMLQAIVLDNISSVGKYLNMDNKIKSDIEFIPYEISNMQDLEWEDGVLKVKKTNATLTITCDMPANTEAYLRLKKFDINNSGQSQFYFSVHSSGVSKSTRATSTLYDGYYGRENYLFNLGYSGQSRQEFVITFSGIGEFKLDDIELYALPMNSYPEYIENLRAEPLENVEWGINKISGTIDLSEDKILCMSIPYSKGWSATVDGENVEILRGNYMFMALPLEAGYHDIEFNYCSPGLKLGVILSCVSWFIVLGILLQNRKRKNKVT